MVQLLPTPVDPSKGGGSSRSGDRIGETPSLQGMARKGSLLLWRTPQARDWRNARAIEKWTSGERQPGLNDQVAATFGKRGTVAERNGQLNPQWVEWLMGFPIGWTELEY